jgi:hypothetical protein
MGHVFTCTCLTEKGVEYIISTANYLVAHHLPIRMDPMLETIKLPTSISDLNTGLAHVGRNALPHSSLSLVKSLDASNKMLTILKKCWLSAQKNSQN